jgi:ankyrin repeat protein
LKHGADVNETNGDLWTPLIEATKRNDKDLVWELVGRGAEIKAKDKSGMSALHYAIHKQQRDITWLLLNKATDTPVGSDLFHTSLRLGDLSTAWLLRAHGADINAANAEGMPALHKACLDKNLDNVRFLLEQGADISTHDKRDLTPLYYAVMGGDEEIMGLIASRTSRHGQLELKLHGGSTALTLATCEKKLGMVKLLLQHGASCDTPGASGVTPLHWAARMGFSQGLQSLLVATSDPNMIDDAGYTALHHAVHDDFAAKDDQRNAIDVLIKHQKVQSNVEEGTNSFTPLMLAAQLGNFRAVRQLAENGVEIHRRNSKGLTVLDILSYERQAEFADLFRKKERERQAGRRQTRTFNPGNTAL